METDTLQSSSRDVGLSGFHAVTGAGTVASSFLFRYLKLYDREKERFFVASCRLRAYVCVCVCVLCFTLFIFVLCEMNFLVVVDLLLRQSKNSIVSFCV